MGIRRNSMRDTGGDKVAVCVGYVHEHGHACASKVRFLEKFDMYLFFFLEVK